uniref:Protein kinase domain-containing protein n=1 Tax=Haptolina ericina TaxID=156174 RepID=A0A7S3BDE7_9EUKA
MHNNGVCHRDLSLDNILLAAGPRCNIKLVDFDTCGPTGRPLTRKIERPSPIYLAPELLAASPEYQGAQTDIWALGVICHVLLTGKFPFVDEAAIRAAQFDLPPDLPVGAAELVHSMLRLDPSARPSADAVCTSAWVLAGSELAGGGLGGIGKLSTSTWAAPKVDPQVLGQLVAMGAPAKAVQAAVDEDLHNELTTTHFLLERRRQREFESAKLAAEAEMAEGDEAAAEGDGAEGDGAEGDA